MTAWLLDPHTKKARQRAASHRTVSEIRMESGPGLIIAIPFPGGYSFEEERFWAPNDFGPWSGGLHAWVHYLSREERLGEWQKKATALAKQRNLRRLPYLAVAVPSEPGWFRKEVAAFWKAKSFRYCYDLSCWIHKVSATRWTPAQWLRATKKHYDQLWPGLRWSAEERDEQEESR